jgi:acyl-CoA reductase-like NAD-dependent aldehyde dehydrogenase
MSFDERRITELVERVLARLESTGELSPPGVAGAEVGVGLHPDVDTAVERAWRAHRHLMTLPLGTRREMVLAMRRAIRASTRLLAEIAVSETGMGRVEDKIKKNLLVGEKTPGVEILQPTTYTGDHGMTLIEPAPYGVVAAVTPSTNPSETVINNGIGLVAAGNGVVFAPHPGAREVTTRTVAILNEAIRAAGGPSELLCVLSEPSIELTGRLMHHPRVRLVVVTGGPGVVKAAMSTGKKVVAAGPGNPPVVVDETASLPDAARDVVLGASFDNNIVCSDEKEVIAVERIFDRFLDELSRADARVLTPQEVDRITRLVIAESRGGRRHGVVNRAVVGKSAAHLMTELGEACDERIRLLIAPVPPDHPLMWTEQMTSVMPITRVPDVDAAISLAREVEHGYGHTAVMHSTNIENLSRMARVMDTCIFVKNGPAYAGLGFGGEGPTSFTIAHPTGDGLSNALTFSRIRRCTLVDAFRIV